MRNKTFLVLLLVATAISFSVQKSYAQDDIDQFLLAGLDDANILAEGYIAPFVNGLSTGIGNGWYNTAATHKKFGFDLTVTVNAAYVPDNDLFYTPNFVGSTQYESGNGPSPTMFGPDETPVYRWTYTDDNQNTYTGTINGPTGLKDEIGGIQAVPVPMANLSIGLVKNTDIKIRWTPEIKIGDDATFKLIGFALQHDIKQHIPGLKLLPFDMSVLVGFTDISTDVFISDQASFGDGEVSSTDGVVGFDVNTWTFQAIASKKFSVVTFYGGLGYNVSKSNMRLLGNFEASYDNGFTSESETFTDPLDLNFSQNGFRATAGMRLKFAFFTLHGDYTLQKYNTLTVGLGFNFREN